MATRARNQLWLLDKVPVAEIVCPWLPSKERCLLLYFHHHQEGWKAKSESIRLVLEAFWPIWEKANIPTTTKKYAGEKLVKLINTYDALRKNRTKPQEGYHYKEAMFKSDMEEIFDVADSSMLSSSKVPQEDMDFFTLQREDQMLSSLAGVDQKNEKQKRDLAAKARKMKSDAGVTQLMKVAHLEADGSSTETNMGDEDDANETYQAPSTSKAQAPNDDGLHGPESHRCLGSRQLVHETSNVSSFAAAAQSLGHELDELAILPATIHRTRKKIRKEIGEELTQKFKASGPLILHWDGKLLEDITKEKKEVDRIAVVVTGHGVEKLLGVPTAVDGTGWEEAAAVLQEVQAFGISEQIIGLGFDTTAVNAGVIQGACVHIQQELGCPMLWLACSHHILEVLLKDVFVRCLGPSSSPDFLLFKRFQKRWGFIDQGSVLSISDEADPPTADDWANQASSTKEYPQQKLFNGTHPREDYRELLILSYRFLDGQVQGRFRQPGVYHHVNWSPVSARDNREGA